MSKLVKQWCFCVCGVFLFLYLTSYNSNVSWVDIRALVWSVAQGACHVICPLLGLYL